MSWQYRDADFLREQYVHNQKSAPEIADLCNVSSSTISRWLDRHGIERDRRYQDREWLLRQYVFRQRDQHEIAADCGVAESTICYWLSRHDITDGESMESGMCESCGGSFRYYPSVGTRKFCSTACANEPRKRQVEVTCPNCDESFERWASLDTQYCSMACWGADHETDTDGYYLGLWQRQREKALKRDSYECTVCGITDHAHRERFGRGLEVHHETPVRLFKQWNKPPEHAHVLANLTTVCRTHHPDAPGSTVELTDS
ncbi:hypothetical protein [Halovenus sp. HT40]|uniref:hypothetical protein n=1 Tax=Halovenus sp. HT40 TaxID=3126691 RepID=UPI00300E8E23